MSDRVIRLRPFCYLHVLDTNTCIQRVEVGPKNFVRKDHEQITVKPRKMINIPPRHYCQIKNPAIYQNEVVQKEKGQVLLRHGQVEYRLHDEWKHPFPLYPGELLQTPKPQQLRVVGAQQALCILAVRHCEVEGKKKVPGEEWLFNGPGTYIPRIEEKIKSVVPQSIVMANEALKLRAIRNFIDRHGTQRIKGEEWLITKQGAYIPDVYEANLGTIPAKVLTEKMALELKAVRTFIDVYKKRRKAGSKWLVTCEDAQTHLPGINEKVIKDVPITILSPQQYCIILHPKTKDLSENQWGVRELRKGECQFFLQPGEELEKGIQEAIVLAADEALLLRAREKYTPSNGEPVKHPGEEWLITGPCKYFQPMEVVVVGSKRKAIPLDDNEGIYIRNTKTGKISTIKGETFLLGVHDEKWSKPITQEIEKLLQSTGYRGPGAKFQSVKRDPWKAVTFRVQHGNAAQIYDYESKKSRVVIGPELVMLEPFEEFTNISLSGGRPKKENQIQSIQLALGPDFMNDELEVETADHARLKLALSYNWNFEYDAKDEEAKAKLFSIRDFVGDTCKTLASRIRGAVATQNFDDFHKNSANIIRKAVFGQDKNGEALGTLIFPTNFLRITNVDVQSVEPVEQRTRDALAKSVQQAIEITRKSQENWAKHMADKEEQNARDALQTQKIQDDSNSEADRNTLVTLEAQTKTVAAIGRAEAEANARVEEALIMANAAVTQAEQKIKAQQIRADARLEQLKSRQSQEIEHKKALNKIDIDRYKKESEIEVSKFRDIVTAIGPETIEAIARAGPEMQAKLLEGMGLQGFLVTDGTSPINLFNTANGLIGGQ